MKKDSAEMKIEETAEFFAAILLAQIEEKYKRKNSLVLIDESTSKKPL